MARCSGVSTAVISQRWASMLMGAFLALRVFGVCVERSLQAFVSRLDATVDRLYCGIVVLQYLLMQVTICLLARSLMWIRYATPSSDFTCNTRRRGVLRECPS